jgi:outer membrane assembly lipoprotein YfiO
MRTGVPEAAARRRRLARGLGLAAAVGAGALACGTPRVGVPPADPEYELRLGLLQAARGRNLEAQEHLKKFLDLHPGHAKADSAQLVLGRAKMGAKLFPEAAVEFQILGQEYPRSPLRDEAAFLECVSYLEQVRSPQLDPTLALRARTCFGEYLARYPGGSDSSAAVAHLHAIADHLAEKDLRLGALFVRMKRPEAARVYLEGLLASYPGTRWEPDAWLYLGRAREQLHAPAEAAVAYRRVLESYPDSEAAREARERLAALNLPPSPEDGGGTAPLSP